MVGEENDLLNFCSIIFLKQVINIIGVILTVGAFVAHALLERQHQHEEKAAVLTASAEEQEIELGVQSFKSMKMGSGNK